MNVEISIDTNKPSDYDKLIKCKQLPRYEVIGNKFITDQQSYDFIFGEKLDLSNLTIDNKKAFDYQLYVVNTAIRRKKYAAFLDCGLGKTFITLMWHQALQKHGKTLLICPLSVVQEFIYDADKFGFDTAITVINETNYKWESGIGILNYEDRKEIDMRGVVGVSLDESSILKNESGSTKNWLVNTAKNVDFKLCTSATPAPNEQSEYATHAVFLDICRTEKEFYSRFFRKQGNSFVLKKHAIDAFYVFMQSFSCYIHNPELLGFECGGYMDEEPEYIIDKVSAHDLEYTNGTLLSTDAGFKSMKAIERYRCKTGTERFNKVIETAQKYDSAIVWCSRNDEADNIEANLPGAVQIKAKKGHKDALKRVETINKFRSGEIKYIVSKPSILGFGVNLQQAEAHIYSGYDQSMESFYQTVRRSHRYGRKGRLKVHIPMIPQETAIYETIERKLKTFSSDVKKLQMNFSIK